MEALMNHFLSFLFLLIAVWSLNGIAQDLTGRVVSISDGDTLTVLVDRQQVKVRLAEIDTPKRDNLLAPVLARPSLISPSENRCV